MSNFGLVVIGACHGSDLVEDINKIQKPILLVEPVDYNFKLLKKNFANHDNVHFEQSFISNNTKSIFFYYVRENSIKKLGKHILVRCNLTIIVANKRFNDLPEFFKEHQVEVVSSLPSFTQDRTDRQRGDGVFEDSIKALRMLNAVGYGQEGSGLVLNLVYNPAGAFLPPSQIALEKEYKKELSSRYGILFNQLFAITNMPISRYLDYLLTSGNYEMYMDKLISAFNPASVQNLMCRNMLSVGWDGYLYDCDFNQMLDLKVSTSTSQHISSFDFEGLKNRDIVIKQHCFGCTAGEGSSCGGSLSV